MNGMDENVQKAVRSIASAQDKGAAPEDYTGEDGLLYCGKCHTPKQMRINRAPMKGSVVYILCRCEQEKRQAEEQRRKEEERKQRVDSMKRAGFLSVSMREWTFANDNGRNPQMKLAREYVNHWEDMREKNIGLLLWGDVGSGKSYIAGCIANALLNQEIMVRMTNFSAVMNDLSGSFEGRNAYLEKLSSCPLLILDDFGMERGTEYGLEQVYSVIDGRYRGGKPLIVTTNLTLSELRNPQDTAHKRIYDRVLEMCVPVRCTGVSFRKKTAEEKLREMQKLLDKNREGE